METKQPISLVENPKAAAEAGFREQALVVGGNQSDAIRDVADQQTEALTHSLHTDLLTWLHTATKGNSEWIITLFAGVAGGVTSGLLQLALLTSFIYFTKQGINYILSGDLHNFLKNNNIGILTKNVILPISSVTQEPEVRICGTIPSLYDEQIKFKEGIAQFGIKGTLVHVDRSIGRPDKVLCAPLFIEKSTKRFHSWREHIIPFPLCYHPWSSATTLEHALELEACMSLLDLLKEDYTIDDKVKNLLGIKELESAIDESILKKIGKSGPFSISGVKYVPSLLERIKVIAFEGDAVRKPTNYSFYVDIGELSVEEGSIWERISTFATLFGGRALKNFLRNKKIINGYSRTKVRLSVKSRDQSPKIEEKRSKLAEKEKGLEEIMKTTPAESEQVKEANKEISVLRTEIENRVKSTGKSYFYTGDNWSIRWLVDVVVINNEYTKQIEFWRLFYLAAQLCHTTEIKDTPSGKSVSESKINVKMVNILLKALVDSVDEGNPDLNAFRVGINRMRITILEQRGEEDQTKGRELETNLKELNAEVNKYFEEQTIPTFPVVESSGAQEAVASAKGDVNKFDTGRWSKRKRLSRRFVNPLTEVQGGGIRKRVKNRRTHKKRTNRKKRNTRKNKNRKTKNRKKNHKNRKTRKNK